MANMLASTTAELPAPDDHPSADVVVFDGKCSFCRASVERIRWFDGKNRVAYISLHNPVVAERYPDLTHDQLMDQMYLVDGDGNRHGGVRALRYLSRKLPKLWIAAPLLHIPFSLPLWSWGYRFVARNRYLIMGKQADCDSGTCKI
jgi:predicted DCC family thiol-disulfide oxidoreductase YuxK